VKEKLQYLRKSSILIFDIIVCGMDDRDSTAGRSRDFLLLHLFQTDTEVCPALYAMGTWGSRGVKLSDHLHVVPRLKNRGAISTLPYTS
jgi:hypothetical protein